MTKLSWTYRTEFILLTLFGMQLIKSKGLFSEVLMHKNNNLKVQKHLPGFYSFYKTESTTETKVAEKTVFS